MTDQTKTDPVSANELNLTEYLEFAKEIALGAGSILIQHFRSLDQVHRKSNQTDLVTLADLQSEHYLTNKISQHYPTHTVLAEESNLHDSSRPFQWVIDPLDGTTNYVHGLPLFAVSIGLVWKQKTILGVVYNPVTEEMFSASLGSGAMLNNRPLSVSATTELIESILATGFPYQHDNAWHQSFELLHDIHHRVQGIRRLGAAALDFCFVADGRLDGYYEFRLKPWDICAGALILSEAGGRVTDWNDAPMPFSGSRVLATNGFIHQELISVLENDKYQTYFDIEDRW